jgi:Pentapeptide repeats (8 copies)
MARIARRVDLDSQLTGHPSARIRHIVYAVCATLLLSILLYLCIFTLPSVIYHSPSSSDLAGVSSANNRLALEQSTLQLQNSIRTTLIQGLAAAFFVVTAYFGWQQLVQNSQQLAISRYGQVTEHFTKAVGQLGDSSPDIRIGGIFGLARIAKESPSTDGEAVAQILIGYIRSRAPWPPTHPGQYIADAPIKDVPSLRTRAIDVQTALTALGAETFAIRGAVTEEALAQAGSRRQMSGVDLRRANMWGANFPGYWFEGANLQGAGIRKANLRRSNLQDANLQGANLQGTDLRGANLQNALLQGADLSNAVIGNAELSSVVARNVRSSYWLPSTDPDSQITRFIGARADSLTLWPVGFEPTEAGVIVETD